MNKWKMLCGMVVFVVCGLVYTQTSHAQMVCSYCQKVGGHSHEEVLERQDAASQAFNEEEVLRDTAIAMGNLALEYKNVIMDPTNGYKVHVQTNHGFYFIIFDMYNEDYQWPGDTEYQTGSQYSQGGGNNRTLANTHITNANAAHSNGCNNYNHNTAYHEYANAVVDYLSANNSYWLANYYFSRARTYYDDGSFWLIVECDLDANHDWSWPPE